MIEEWPAMHSAGAIPMPAGLKFYTKTVKSGRRGKQPHVVYLLMDDDPPVDLSEVEMFADLMNRKSAAS
ncbi:hypothetical protein [Sphingopyxis sp. 113P3]|uniref:hypothetical protein n=1 Tax=Sphingopyxis sp. (strain 113P3) TaxID=292913 RepID=UPI0006BD06BD|nr:hypothetical protein [Sphingopyxis sp. 113P3]ALC14677.1 hypothetical protein LH20_22175 [Sphingopyxis sp. 113P3]